MADITPPSRANGAATGPIRAVARPPEATGEAAPITGATDRLTLSGKAPTPAGPAPTNPAATPTSPAATPTGQAATPTGQASPPASADLAARRAVREQATIVLDQGAREGRYVPTDWLTDAAAAIAKRTRDARDPLLAAIGAEAAQALAEAKGRTGEGEAAALLAAFLKTVEARIAP